MTSFFSTTRYRAALLALPLLLTATGAHAQDGADDEERRVRIALGPELKPSYPGASDHSLGPFIDVDIARGDTPFAHEAADESTGLPLLNLGAIDIGPIVAVTGKRTAEDTTPGLREIGTTFEAGASITATISPSIYAFAEVLHGIGGHDALRGQAGVDFVTRDGDAWVLAAGPRMTFGSGKHARAYFGVTPAEAAASGLDAFDPDGGIQSIGGAITGEFAITPRWGLAAYGRLERLIGDAADSPVTRTFGKRSQLSGGVALTYTFRR